MKLLNKEVVQRAVIKLDKSIVKKDSGINGLMQFGIQNDYPQVIEKLINGSVTAKTSANIYSKFLTGLGFENEAINNIVVGVDSRGKKITLQTLLRQIAISISRFNGFYIHTNLTLGRKVKDVHLKSFKNMRFAKPDDSGYSAKLMYYDNWGKDSANGKYDKNLIKEYNVFNLNSDVFTAQIKEAGSVEKYKGQVYFEFLDNEYFYPLSVYDDVYLDLDTEAQISLYKNRQIRNGFFNKIVFRVEKQAIELDENGNEIQNENTELADSIRSFMGADGETALILEDELNEDGEIEENGGFRIDQIESNIDDALFENWEKSLSNNIRKSSRIPELLMDFQQVGMGNISGASIKVASDLYNAITADDRAVIEKSIEEIFINSENKVLAKNTNWKIKPLELGINDTVELQDETPKNINEEAQASLRGSVGGVQGILSIQQGVSSGTSDYDAAIEILKEIYGFTEEKAIAILGTPKLEENGITDNNTATSK